MQTIPVHWQVALVGGGLLFFLVWETLAPFFVQRQRLRHGLRNVSLSLLNAALLVLAVAGVTVAASEASARLGIGMLYRVPLPPALHGVLAFLVLDLWMYWWHRFNHTVPFLWRFHRMHHSDPAMDVTTANRFHVGEILMSSVLRVVLVVVAGIPIGVVLVYDLLQAPLIYFHHANIGLPSALDRVVRLLIVSPFMHKIHHSRVQAETDSNYTSVLSVWDRVFGSYRETSAPHEIRFGLDGLDGERWQSIPGMLKTPVQS